MINTNIFFSYKPYVDLDVNTTETIEEFYKRTEKVMQSAVRDTEKSGKTIYIISDKIYFISSLPFTCINYPLS